MTAEVLNLFENRPNIAGKFHEIQKTNNAHDVTMMSNTYRFCWKQVLTSKV